MEISSSDQKMETTRKVKSEKGGLRTLPFIIANETFEKVASFGLLTNMILYLKNEYGFDNAKGASILFYWFALSNFTPTIGAFLSDSYLGRFKTITIGTFISLLGMILLWLTAILPKSRPPHCEQSSGICASVKLSQLLFLLSSFVLMSIGAGGIRPCSLAFGADQLNKPQNQNNERILQSFFNWYYASVGISIMISGTIIVYIQNTLGWVVGFGVPVGLMLISIVMLLLGSPLYIKWKPNQSLITSFAQVIVALWKNNHKSVSQENHHVNWFYHQGSKLVVPTDSLRFLNKACALRNPVKDLTPEGLARDPWTLCTVKQVEQLKALIKVLPIWSTGIILSATIFQHSFSTLQATTMDRRITAHFKFPAASFNVFSILMLTIWVAIYDRILVPLLSKFTKKPCGLGFNQRMGIGLAIACLALVVSGEVERYRRERAIQEGLLNKPHAVVNMSAMWLVPQHCLIGLAEAFYAIGQIEFYYSQFPRSMASICVALLSLGMAFGNLVGALIVGIVGDLTKKGGKDGWLSDNLNKGHYDYYYQLLAILGVINFFYYIVCSYFYGDPKRNWDEEEEIKEVEVPN